MSIKAKKSLGQHFLRSKNVIQKIIETAKIQKGEKILEIGPGTGVLTEALLHSGGQIIAIEKDIRAIDLLNQKFQADILEKKLTVIYGDVLSDSQIFIPKPPYAIVANIPYYITGAILEFFLEKGPQPDRMVLLVQKEVADRILARDGKESILSISVKVFGQPEIVAKVPRGAFDPVPNVDSAILSINNISNDRFTINQINSEKFFMVVKNGFSHKRKILIRNLESLANREVLEKIWNKLKIEPKARAENLSLENWISITQSLNTKT